MNTMELEKLILLRDSGEISPAQLQELERMERADPAVQHRVETTSRILDAARRDVTPSDMTEVTRSSIIEAGKVALTESGILRGTVAMPPSRPTGNMISWLPASAWAAAATVVIGALLGVMALLRFGAGTADAPGFPTAHAVNLVAVDLLLVESDPIDEQLASLSAMVNQDPAAAMDLAIREEETNALARELLELEGTRI